MRNQLQDEKEKADTRVDDSQYERPLATASENKLVPTCTCLSISRDPLCVFHGDVDKVNELHDYSICVACGYSDGDCRCH